MPILYLAVNKDEQRAKHVPKKIALTSRTIMKQELRQYTNSEWQIKKLVFKPSTENLCALVNGTTKIPFVEKFYVTISQTGRWKQK